MAQKTTNDRKIRTMKNISRTDGGIVHRAIGKDDIEENECVPSHLASVDIPEMVLLHMSEIHQLFYECGIDPVDGKQFLLLGQLLQHDSDIRVEPKRILPEQCFRAAMI